MISFFFLDVKCKGRERERENYNNSIPFAIISFKIKKQYVISFYITFIQTLYKELMAVSL